MMERKCSYEDFEPFCKWHLHDGKETIDIYLKGFKKDQLKVQTNNRGVLSVYGERPLDGSKWSRFRLETKLPKDCDVKEIYARFSNGILSIEMPSNVHPLVKETELQNINAATEANKDGKQSKVHPLVNEIEHQNINVAMEADGDAKHQITNAATKASKDAKNAKEVSSSRSEQQLMLKEKDWVRELKYISKRSAFKVAFAAVALTTVMALGVQLAHNWLVGT